MMEFGVTGFEQWIWITAWFAVPSIVFLLWWGEKKRKSDGKKLGQFNTIFRLVTDDIWKTGSDAQKARYGDQNIRTKAARLAFRKRRNIKSIFLVLAIVCMILAMGKPRWGAKQEKIYKQGIDLVLLVDTSKSMKAEDVAPSRLAKAKSEIAALLAQLENNRVGLVGFASTTKLHCPLTLDFRGLRSILEHSLTLGTGTNIEKAVLKALQVLKGSDVPSKAIIIISDGEGHEGDIDNVIQMAQNTNVNIFCLGIGTMEGGPIPETSGNGSANYKKQHDKLVWTKLTETSLKKIAEETGGQYFRASDTEIEAKSLADEIKSMEKTRFSQTVTTRKDEQFGFFLILAILFLAIELCLGDFGSVTWETDNA